MAVKKVFFFIPTHTFCSRMVEDGEGGGRKKKGLVTLIKRACHSGHKKNNQFVDNH